MHKIVLLMLFSTIPWKWCWWWVYDYDTSAADRGWWKCKAHAILAADLTPQNRPSTSQHPSGPRWINTSEYPSQPNANKLGNSGYFRPAHQSGPAQLDTLGFTQNLWTVWNSVSKCSVASQNRLWSAQPISVWKHQP